MTHASYAFRVDLQVHSKDQWPSSDSQDPRLSALHQLSSSPAKGSQAGRLRVTASTMAMYWTLMVALWMRYCPAAHNDAIFGPVWLITRQVQSGWNL